MRKTLPQRTLHTALIGFGTAVVLAAASSPVAGFVPEIFDGGGYGPTAEIAVRQAIGDAETTASAYGLYACALVGEPEVFPQPPGSLRAFRAQVQLRCM